MKKRKYMKKNFKDTLKDFNNFFENEPSKEMQSWSLLNDFYHLILTYMKKNKINQSQLARKLNISRSAISQLFNNEPNVSIKKISEIANAIGLNLKLTSEQVELPEIKREVYIKYANSSFTPYIEKKDTIKNRSNGISIISNSITEKFLQHNVK